ncbi:MAG: superinfection exclusion B family protein [Clostridia bacterium]|nr:superinfection exclusion B family protein [Clostridia bacterium]
MEGVVKKIIEYIKIPLRVLLPAVCIFSGFVLFASDNLLEKLNLLQWSNDNGFVFGLLFIVSLSLIIVYALFYLKETAFSVWNKTLYLSKQFKRIAELDSMELAIIAYMYNSPGYSQSLDYNKAIVQGLVSSGYIYSGGSQLVRMSIFDTSVPINFCLQPFVWKALDKYLPILRQKCDRISKKNHKTKCKWKKEKESNTLENMKIILSYFDNYHPKKSNNG